MRDLSTWSLPLFRAFEISVRLHLLYILVTIGLILRVVVQSPEAWLDFVILFVVMLFVAILLHEYGHCFAARSVDGEADQILIWPLGGLAYCDVPHTPRANLITAAAGPAVTLGLAFLCSVILLSASYIPPLNPIQNPYRLEMKGFDGKTYIGKDDARWQTAEGKRLDGEVVSQNNKIFVIKKEGRDKELIEVTNMGLPTMSSWAMWVGRFFWLNWLLFLFNLLPGFPLDGGRIFQSIIWGRSEDYRRGTTVAIYAGYISAIGLALAGIILNELLLFFLALFIYISCRHQQYQLDTGMEDSPYGDFSQGYTSLERDEPVERKPRRPGLLRRWFQRRASRRLQREHQRRMEEEARMDELLEKISREGRESLTTEEKRFLERVSSRYRNRSQGGTSESENW